MTVRVLYIAGSGRSGSTLLARLLDQVDGLFAPGELRYVWQRGLIEDRFCSCGQRFGACPFWTKTLDQAFGGRDGVDPHAMSRAQRSTTRARHLPRALLSTRHPAGARHLGGYAAAVSALYRSIQDVSGAEVVVDSSKLPTYGHLLTSIPGIEVAVVHLVRDPRAAAHSWLRPKAQPDRGGNGIMQQQGAAKSAVLWDTWNAAALRLFANHHPRLLLRYEDLVDDPRHAVARVLDLIGHGAGPAGFADDRTVTLRSGHSVAGNPDRLSSGPTHIRLDDEWMTALDARRRTLVTALTAPLLRRFDYPLRVGRASGRRSSA
ncbi:MAG TPA: sulfotransferase [Acidimicrobiales bacterium]|nr:sulfotransferase [Acidimicrobiales bacterium]